MENEMFNKFYPDEWRNSTYEIDFEGLYEEGIRGIIFDIDNTLVPHGAPPDLRAISLFEQLKDIGFKCCLLSNNKERRVQLFNGPIEVHTISRAGKPKKSGYERAMTMMGTDKVSTIFIGDQLFTDIWGAKNTGIRNILVKPIDKKEEVQIVLKRYLERIVLSFYKKERKKS